METVTVSSKFQVVIPKRLRGTLGIKRGQRLAMLLYDGQLRLIPIRPIKEMQGFVKGMDTTIEREPDRI